MQEQHPYKITPEQGWSRMLPVLDQVMPVERRTKRFILFWWTAAAVLTGGLIAMFMLIDSNSNYSPSVANKSHYESLPSTEHQDIPVAKSIESTPSLIESVPQEITQTEEKTLPGGKNETENKLSNLSSPSSKTIAGKKNENVFVQTTIENGIENIDIANNLKASELISELSSEQEVEPINDIVGPVRMNEELLALPFTEIAELEFETETLMDIQPDKIRKFDNGKNLITPYLSAGVIDGFESGFGVNASAGLNINFLPRLSLTSGVGYTVYSPDSPLFGCACSEDELANSGGLLRDDLGFQGIGNYLPEETVNNASGGQLNSFVSTIRQWQLSAGLKYDLTRRFFTEGGVSFGFGTTAHSSYPIISIDYSAPLSGDQLKISRSFRNVIKSSTTSVYAGIGYRLSPKTELYASATHSFDHYFLNDASFGADSSERNDYIRGLNIGMRYNLQGP